MLSVVVMMICLAKVRESEKGMRVRHVVCRVSSVSRAERASRDSGVPPTASELEAVPSFRKKSGENGDVMRRVLDSPALDEERNVYPLAQDAFKEAQQT